MKWILIVHLCMGKFIPEINISICDGQQQVKSSPGWITKLSCEEAAADFVSKQNHLDIKTWCIPDLETVRLPQPK